MSVTANQLACSFSLSHVSLLVVCWPGLMMCWFQWFAALWASISWSCQVLQSRTRSAVANHSSRSWNWRDSQDRPPLSICYKADLLYLQRGTLCNSFHKNTLLPQTESKFLINTPSFRRQSHESFCEDHTHVIQTKQTRVTLISHSSAGIQNVGAFLER